MDQPKIPDFIQNLQKSTSSKKGGKGKNSGSSDDLKFINMRNFENHGEINIVLFNSNDGVESIQSLNNIFVIEKWVSGTTKEGKDYGFVSKSYFLTDPRLYGNLTPEQMERFERIKSKLSSVPEKRGIYRQNITLLTGYVINHKSRSQQVLNSDQPAVISIVSRNFDIALDKALKAQNDKLGGDWAWYPQLSSRELTRKRYLELELYMDQQEGAGYQCRVLVGKFDDDTLHLTKNKELFDISDNPTILDKFTNPIKRMLGFEPDEDLFDEEYLNDIEASANKAILGEPLRETRIEQGEAKKVDSAASYKHIKENPETPEIKFSEGEGEAL